MNLETSTLDRALRTFSNLSLSLPTRAFADLRRSCLSLLLSYELPFIPNNLCESSGNAFDLSCPDAYELPPQSLPRL